MIHRRLRSLGRVSLSALLTAMLVTASAQPVAAEVRLAGIFTDNMVLQCDMPIYIWGTGENGDEVAVAFGDQEEATTVNDGRWKVSLGAMSANADPQKLVVSSGDDEIELTNVLIGEVWIASGQSNMVWPIQRSADPEATAAAADVPQLRLFTVQRKPTPEPQGDLTGIGWHVTTPETVPEFSAVAYHFGRHLHEQLGVPVGLVSTNVGGTPAEAWTSREALADEPSLKPLLDIEASRPTHNASVLYNAMIHPLVPMAFRGAIWYQGESNAGRAYQYRTLLRTMVQDWRSQWGRDFPFLIVQLAPFRDIQPEPGDSQWAELRESQLLVAQTTPPSALAVITDIGDEKDIHPKQKAPVGTRLALAARALAYGEDIEHSGPVYREMEIDGSRAILHFDHLGGGLTTKGSDGPQGFTICGADQKFVHADAKIEGDTLVVSSDQVAEPVAVRFGWADYPVVDLWNEAGLPASPFRTDDFPLTTMPK